jgi:serine/threonine-protein kinase
MYPEGVVIAHEPVAGDEVAKGITIYVTVSKGPQPETKPAPVQMQDLTGMKQAAAEKILQDYSVAVRISVMEEASDTVPEGSVTRTVPAYGQSVEDGQTVQLWISTGPLIKTGIMPNVTGERKETAAKTLNSQNLALNVRYEEIYHKSVQEGFVVETDPVAGVELSTGDTVTLFISKGPQMQNMLNVVGMDIATAVKVLVDAGFSGPDIVLVYSSEPKDTVVSQSHEKNVEIDISTQITLEVSKGPEPTEPPTTLPTRDILIDLLGHTSKGRCNVEVLLGKTVIYSEVVEKDTAAVLLTGQSGV